MPELPEVETVVRSVRPRIVGRKIARVVLASPLMFESKLGSAESALTNRRFERMDRQGKFMFLGLSDGNTLLVHLGMTGRLGVVAAQADVEPHTHFRILLNGMPKEELRFSDPRRFGELVLLDEQSLKARCGPRRLGPDALTIRTSRLIEVLSQTKRSVKAVLMDQRTLAGVGNIYADEALFATGIHPARPSLELNSNEIAKLARAIREILKRSIASNGTTIRNYVDGSGAPGEFRNRLKVYGRAGEPCRRCESAIEMDRTILSNRATCFCPRCQS